jgi:GxxExxY protein
MAATDLAHAELTERLIAQFFTVYNELGGGFAEAVYANAYAIALAEAGIDCDRERAVEVRFRGRRVGVGRPDFIAAGAVVVECKAVRILEDWQLGQVLHYLKATGLSVALLLNFGPKPSFKRIVNRG